MVSKIKHITITTLLSLGLMMGTMASAKVEVVRGYVDPNVKAINNKLRTPLPDISFIQHQEIEIKKGKLISKKALLSGVRIEEVKLSKIDVNNITISKSLGDSYYFVTIFCEEGSEGVSFGYQPMKVTQKTDLENFNLKSLDNKGNLNHFCLSVNSMSDAQEIVEMIKALAASK